MRTKTDVFIHDALDFQWNIKNTVIVYKKRLYYAIKCNIQHKKILYNNFKLVCIIAQCIKEV